MSRFQTTIAVLGLALLSWFCWSICRGEDTPEGLSAADIAAALETTVHSSICGPAGDRFVLYRPVLRRVPLGHLRLGDAPEDHRPSVTSSRSYLVVFIREMKGSTGDGFSSLAVEALDNEGKLLSEGSPEMPWIVDSQTMGDSHTVHDADGASRMHVLVFEPPPEAEPDVEIRLSSQVHGKEITFAMVRVFW